jgi:hypothetical protein
VIRTVGSAAGDGGSIIPQHLTHGAPQTAVIHAAKRTARFKAEVARITEILAQAQRHIDAAERLMARGAPKPTRKRKRRKRRAR